MSTKPAGQPPSIGCSKRIVFVGGLHRSGTTVFARALSLHPQVAGLSLTNVPMDEGQHLQSVYPPARELGGPGVFGFSSDAHITEQSPLVSPSAREKLLNSWRPYWDMTKPMLLEKSPPNLLRMRFLQALFPRARFVVVVRHPVPVALATRRWTAISTESVVRHWGLCHRLLLDDLPYVRALRIVRYEDIVAAPAHMLVEILSFLGLEGETDVTGIKPGRSERYFIRWAADGRRIDSATAQTAALFGYDVRHPWDHSHVSPEAAALQHVMVRRDSRSRPMSLDT